jgi:hypothetical protein
MEKGIFRTKKSWYHLTLHPPPPTESYLLSISPLAPPKKWLDIFWFFW